MEQEPLNIYSHPEFQTEAKQFQEKYDLYEIVENGDEQYSKKNLKGYSSRTCLFCGLRYPETKFFNISHLVPKMIGNNSLYSDFECDKCNEKFSGFENDLAEFLGVSRSIAGMSEDKLAPGFMAKKVGAKSRSFVGENILIIAPEDVKRDGAKTTISYFKNPFVPSGVYKALLKCAISLLGEEEVKLHYPLALDYLSGRINIDSGAVIRGYLLPFGTTFPFHAYIFRKKNIEDKVPTHIMCFYFQTHVIVFPIPFHEADSAFSLETDIFLPPPYLTRPEDMGISMTPFLRDLSSNEKVNDEEDQIIIHLDPKSLKNSARYDPVTDTIEDAEYNPPNQKYFILTKNDVKVDPRALSAFIAKFDKDQTEGK